MEVHGDGYDDLKEEDDIYDMVGVFLDGGKWYLGCVRYVVGLYVGGFLVVEVV